MTKKRLSNAERHEKIIQAARLIFSEKGFHGATTRELASAADVSEALLFRHFPSKDAIYAAMFHACMASETGSKAMKLLELKPSLNTLAMILHFVMNKSFRGDQEIRITHRMLLRSLGEDGAFARVLYKNIGELWVPKMRACIRAAQRSGDLRVVPDALKSGTWLAQHLVMMVSLMHAPAEKVLDYGCSDSKLVADSVTFCLRGLGASEDVIKRVYDPAASTLLTDS